MRNVATLSKFASTTKPSVQTKDLKTYNTTGQLSSWRP
jgi:hypothetical protein